MARDQTHQQPGRSAGVAHVERRLGLQQAAHADAIHAPHPVCAARDLRPHRAHRRGRRQNVFPFEQAFNHAFTHRERGQHEGSVGDRLVTGNADRAGERTAPGEGFGRGRSVRHFAGVFDSGASLWQGARRFSRFCGSAKSNSA